MRRPTVELAVEINHSVRAKGAWFEEPDDIHRLGEALRTIDRVDDPVVAAALLAYRVTRTQAFGEGNKRTALLLAKWTLDHNDLDGVSVIPPDDRDLATLLVKASAGANVEAQIVALFEERARGLTTAPRRSTPRADPESGID